MPAPLDRPNPALSRRYFLTGTATAATAPFLDLPSAQAAAQPVADASRTAEIVLVVNRKEYRLALDPRTSLLDALRDHIGLTGAKKSCDHGQCGACTIHIDGRRALSCMQFAVMAEGHEVTTIEGLSTPGGALHPMQQ